MAIVLWIGLALGGCGVSSSSPECRSNGDCVSHFSLGYNCVISAPGCNASGACYEYRAFDAGPEPTFCGCDGTTFSGVHGSPNRPYVHAGPCP